MCLCVCMCVCVHRAMLVRVMHANTYTHIFVSALSIPAGAGLNCRPGARVPERDAPAIPQPPSWAVVSDIIYPYLCLLTCPYLCLLTYIIHNTTYILIYICIYIYIQSLIQWLKPCRCQLNVDQVELACGGAWIYPYIYIYIFAHQPQLRQQRSGPPS